MSTQNVVVLSNVSKADKDALGDILDSLAGTPLERSGDITFIVDETHYVISGQTGRHAAATIVRRVLPSS